MVRVKVKVIVELRVNVIMKFGVKVESGKGQVYFVYMIVIGNVCIWTPLPIELILNTPVMIGLILVFLTLLSTLFIFLILLDVVCLVDCVVRDCVWFDVADSIVDVTKYIVIQTLIIILPQKLSY